MKVRYGDLIRIGRGKQQKSGESMPLSAKESQTLLYIQVWSNQDQ